MIIEKIIKKNSTNIIFTEWIIDGDALIKAYCLKSVRSN